MPSGVLLIPFDALQCLQGFCEVVMQSRVPAMSGTPIASSLPARSGLSLCLRPPGTASLICKSTQLHAMSGLAQETNCRCTLLPAPGGLAAPPSSATSQNSDRSHLWGTSAVSTDSHSPLPSFDPAVLPEVAQEAESQPPGSLGPFNFGGAGPAMDSLGGEQLRWAAWSVCRCNHSSRATCRLRCFTCSSLNTCRSSADSTAACLPLGTACAAAPTG